jgi:hypothetical protein
MNDVLQYKTLLAVVRDKQIIIFTTKRNDRVYKKKCWDIGAVFFNEKTSNWCFAQNSNWCIGAETMLKIAILLSKLDNAEIGCDFEKGEWITNESNTNEH